MSVFSVRVQCAQTENGSVRLIYGQAKQMGIGKSTLHNLRKKAADTKRFRIYDTVLTKLSWSK